jgi:hypothetical protein
MNKRMTAAAGAELADARPRYTAAPAKDKRKILEQFIAGTGYLRSPFPAAAVVGAIVAPFSAVVALGEPQRSQGIVADMLSRRATIVAARAQQFGPSPQPVPCQTVALAGAGR